VLQDLEVAFRVAPVGVGYLQKLHAFQQRVLAPHNAQLDSSLILCALTQRPALTHETAHMRQLLTHT